MVKSYVKYEQSATFGVITSPTSNILWTPSHSNTSTTRSTSAGHAYVAANSAIQVWDIKTGTLLSRWHAADITAEVTCISQSASEPDIFAAGYADGSIRLWDARIAEVLLRFDGHRSAVTCLTFDAKGLRLASGGRDTDVVVWDLVAERGLFKLRGHRDAVTGLTFVAPREVEGEDGIDAGGIGEGFLLSAGKDALIKVWDVGSQYCVETHVTQSNGECWALGMSPDGGGCVTAGNDGEMKVWTIDSDALRILANKLDGAASSEVLRERGTLMRQSRDRPLDVSFHKRADFISVHGSEKAVEIWRIRSPAEVQKSLARKRRRRREKAVATGKENQRQATQEEEQDEQVDATDVPLTEVFVPYVTVRTGGKIRSVAWASEKARKSLELLVSTTNNQIELFNVPLLSDKQSKNVTPEYNRTLAVELPGHRADVRALSLSSDDRMLATASSGSLKIWNVKTFSCLRTLECGYALTCSFLPGDKIVVVGNKNGDLELFDITSSTLIDTVQAHDGAVWTLKVHPDGQSMVSAGADKQAKFWEFKIVNEEIPGTKRTTPQLKLKHTRTLKVNDDILSVCFSQDARLIAVSTLDNTVKVYFVDSLKLYLNLYGHKLPVLSIAISSDSKLVATCSADKTVRLWGLDFGDCHKSFYAHEDSIMQVSFIPHPVSREDAHLFFSASKDHLLKSWDGDKFEHVQKLSGHHGEIWAMAVSQTGDFVVTASHDKSVRIWSQTDEPLFLEEERERELEEMYDANLTNSLDRDQADAQAMEDGEGDRTEVVPASKQTSATLTSSEKIVEALTFCAEDLETMRDYEVKKAATPGARIGLPQRHPVLAFKDVAAEKHLLSVFEAIPSPALHDALLLLSFSILPSLFVFLSLWLEKEMNIPLTCRILFFLLNTHHKQIVASRSLRIQLEEMKVNLRKTLENWKNIMGFNLAATRILGRRVAEAKVKTIEDQETMDEMTTRGKKRNFVNVA